MPSDNSIYFRLPKTDNQGFMVQYDNMAHFYNQLHHHPELQLAYILDGTGDLFVGDSITSFKPGDLFMIGSNQSHIFKSDPKYFEKDSKGKSRAISIFFHDQSLGDGFFEIAETSSLRQLIERSVRGLQFESSVADAVGPDIKKILDITGFDRFLEILSILHKLSETTSYSYLASVSNAAPPSDQESQRVNDVINYILTHYKEDIELQKVAEVANYSKAAFCRFFKQRTRKTFSRFLNEVRVAQACKLLKNSSLNISQICYESGFNNVSNFNRQFKKIMEMTPKDYLKKFEKSLVE